MTVFVIVSRRVGRGLADLLKRLAGSRTSGQVAIGLICAGLLMAIGFAGYQQLFSSFAPYDDEGYLMISLRSFLAGHALYDETFSQYGPAYYVLNGWLHGITQWPVSHDVIRIKTLAVWLATAVMSAGFTFRVTRSTLLALLSLLAVYFHLDRLGLEPGHPQDICLLGVSATLLLGTWLGGAGDGERESRPEQGRRKGTRLRNGRSGVAIALAFGVIAAAVAMTKINIGGLLFGAVAVALLWAAPRSTLRSWLLGLSAGGAVLLPFALARRHVFELDGIQLPIVTVCAIAGLALTAARVDFRGLLPGRCGVAFGGACSLGCLLFAGLALFHGTSLAGLLHGILWQHMGFMQGFYENPPIYRWAAPVAVISLLAAWFARKAFVPRAIRLLLVVLIAGVYLRYSVDTFTPIYHGAEDRGQAALLISLFTPLLWILWLPLLEPAGRSETLLLQSRFPRLLLCVVGVMQPLGVYPIPGTQAALGSLSLLLALIICVGDVMRVPATVGAEGPWFRRGLAVGLISLAVTTVACRVVNSFNARMALTPLGLTGAQQLRLPADFVTSARWTVAYLRAHADTFICLQNGHNSLYLWSGLDPPTAINTTLWQDLLDDERQQRIVDALGVRQRVCVVRNDREPLPYRRDGPLTRYLEACFRPVERHGEISIWMQVD